MSHSHLVHDIDGKDFFSGPMSFQDARTKLDKVHSETIERLETEGKVARLEYSNRHSIIWIGKPHARKRQAEIVIVDGCRCSESIPMGLALRRA